MPHYKGRGEALRLALSIGDIPFEDERLHPHEFAEIRAKLPYRSLPTLTMDGTVYAQSSALLRYLGKLSKLYPEDPTLALRVDEIIDTVIDFITGIEAIGKTAKSTYEKDMIEYLDTGVSRYLGGLERRMKTFGDRPWAVGSNMTIADLGLYMIVLNARAGAWDYFEVSRLGEYPRIMQVAEAVSQHPSVMKWNQSIREKAAAVKRSQAMMEGGLPME